jgi:hypothetical protein
VSVGVQVSRTDIGTSGWLRQPQEGLIIEKYLLGGQHNKGAHEKVMVNLVS